MVQKTIMTAVFAVQTADGLKDNVCEMTEYVSAGTFGNSSELEQGLRYYILDSNGLRVNRLSEKEFRVVKTGELILKV